MKLFLSQSGTFMHEALLFFSLNDLLYCQILYVKFPFSSVIAPDEKSLLIV